MTIAIRISKERQRWLLAATVCCCFTAIIALSRGIVFETVDDYNVMMTISGEKTGYPYFQLTFFNSIYAFLMSLLYRVFPLVQWYTWIQLSLVVLSMTAILSLLIEHGIECGVNPIVSVTFFCIFAVGFFLYPVQRLQFTSTAALLGMTSSFYLFSIDPNELQSKRSKNRLAISCLALCLCIIERRSAGFCACIFFALGMARLWVVNGWATNPLKVYRTLLRGATTVFACSILVAGAFLVGHKILVRMGDNASYAPYDEVRAEYQDHPHPSFEEAEGLYQSVGWDLPLYNLVNSLIFIDEGINEDSFKTIVESPENEQAQFGLFRALRLDLSILKNPAARSVVLGLFGLFFATSCIAYANSREKCPKPYVRAYWYATATCIIAIGLSVYICLGGRWSLRTFQVITLPLAGCLLASFACQLSMIVSKGGQALQAAPHAGRHFGTKEERLETQSGVAIDEACIRRRRSCLAMASVLLMWLLGWSFTSAENYDEVLLKRDAFSITQMRSIEDYARSHPDDVFLHDYSVSNSYNSYDAFRRYVDNPPTNLILSGGSYTYTGCYYEQLRVNGLDSFTGETLLHDNVYYVSDPHRDALYWQRVLTYLQSRYGNVSIETVDVLANGATVFKYRLSDIPMIDEQLEGDQSYEEPSPETQYAEEVPAEDVDFQVEEGVYGQEYPEDYQYEEEQQ